MKDQKVKPNDSVDVIASEIAQHMKAGKVYKMHPVAAKKLVDRGLASFAR